MARVKWDSLTLTGSDKVEVYRNLHRRCWSVRSNKTGRVIDHVTEVYLTDCELVVRKAGREKVLREGRKNVHAFVKGYMITKDEYEHEGDIHISYNPYRNDSFVVKEESIKKANQVFLGSRGESRANGVVTYDK